MNKKNTKEDKDKRTDTETTIKLGDLPPVQNAVGGFIRGYSNNLESSDLYKETETHPRFSESHQHDSFMRLLCLGILSLTGAVVTAFLASIFFGALVVLIASCLGGLAGLILAALFWASE